MCQQKFGMVWERNGFNAVSMGLSVAQTLFLVVILFMVLLKAAKFPVNLLSVLHRHHLFGSTRLVKIRPSASMDQQRFGMGWEQHGFNAA